MKIENYKFESGKIIEIVEIKHEPKAFLDDLKILLSIELQKKTESEEKIKDIEAKIKEVEKLIK